MPGPSALSTQAVARQRPQQAGDLGPPRKGPNPWDDRVRGVQVGVIRANPSKEEQMSTTFDGRAPREIRPAGPEPPPAPAAPPDVSTPSAMTGWGNSGPLALAAFAVPTFMLSAI